ncbi:MAG: histone deacetylase, partial [Desulfobacteraceae bacterium]|nr:histone deacetylase [Desulfobacteraceae bacterium]
MLKAKTSTGLIFFPAYDWAISATHPEREERLLYTQDQISEEGLFDIEGINEFKAEVIDIKDVQRTHFCVPEPEKVMTESHFISAGGAKAIAKAKMDGLVERGFALVRPPGHHAMRVVHGGRGFCNVNNEAIMIEYLRHAYGIDRVAIIDTDCHHGDGTQDIYWHDPDTLFISMHQDGRTLFPGSGFTDETGGPTAAGSTLNIPLPPYTSEEGFLTVIKKVVLPVLNEFKPDLIINSAGQDNHFTDPLTNMNFSAKGYADLTDLLKPDIAVLEGGYSIENALPYVNVGIILAMAGVDYSNVVEPEYSAERLRQGPRIIETIEETCDEALAVWKDRESTRHRLQKKMKYYER